MFRCTQACHPSVYICKSVPRHNLKCNQFKSPVYLKNFTRKRLINMRIEMFSCMGKLPAFPALGCAIGCVIVLVHESSINVGVLQSSLIPSAKCIACQVLLTHLQLFQDILVCFCMLILAMQQFVDLVITAKRPTFISSTPGCHGV